MKNLEIDDNGLMSFEWDNPEEEKFFQSKCTEKHCTLEELFNQILMDSIKDSKTIVENIIEEKNEKSNNSSRD